MFALVNTRILIDFTTVNTIQWETSKWMLRDEKSYEEKSKIILGR